MGKIKITPGSILVLAGRQREDDEAAILEVADTLLDSVLTINPITGEINGALSVSASVGAAVDFNEIR